MKRLILGSMLVLLTVLLLPTTASGQYTFGDWASDHGYSPGAVMPDEVSAGWSSIGSLDGIGEYDWTTTPTTRLYLWDNQITSMESGHFSGLTNLTELNLYRNPITSIESGAFSGLTNLTSLLLRRNTAPVETGLWYKIVTCGGSSVGRT